MTDTPISRPLEEPVLSTQLASDLTAAPDTQTPAISAEEQQKIDEIAAQIDITDPVISIAYGAKTLNAMSRFNESLMQEVRAKDAGEVGAQLTDLLSKVKALI